jgi:hypothetical protein
MRGTATAITVAIVLSAVFQPCWTDESALSPSEERQLRLQVADSIGILRVGLYGELISPADIVPLDEDLLYVVRDGKRLELVTAWLPSAVYAVVDANGTIRPPKKGHGPFADALPSMWPFRDANGRLAAPPPGKTISAAGSVPAPPPNAAGWAFLTAHGVIEQCAPSVELFPNILWCVRTADGGMELVHSGSSRSGVFLRVAADGSITFFSDDARGERATDALPVYWPSQDSEGRPALPEWPAQVDLDLLAYAEQHPGETVEDAVDYIDLAELQLLREEEAYRARVDRLRTIRTRYRGCGCTR